METLKKLLIVAAIILIAIPLEAQNINELQSAFSKSYIAENQNNYSTAINEMKAIYQADN